MAKTDKAPAMPFYGKDAYDDEAFALASFGANGMFLWLSWWQWAEGSIPSDLEAILDKCPRKKVAEAKKLWAEIEFAFPVIPEQPTRRRNDKIETVRASMKSVRDKKRGAAGARWKRDAERDAETRVLHDAYAMQTNDVMHMPAVAVASAVAFAKEEEPPFSSESGGSGTQKNRRDSFPYWTEKAFQYKTDKITEWLTVNCKACRMAPDDEQFEAMFSERWGMSYARWLVLRDRHEAYFTKAVTQ